MMMIMHIYLPWENDYIAIQLSYLLITKYMYVHVNTCKFIIQVMLKRYSFSYKHYNNH